MCIRSMSKTKMMSVLLVDGWKQVMIDVDATVIWNSALLELVCQIAIRGMDRSPKTRLNTTNLLPRLSKVIQGPRRIMKL